MFILENLGTFYPEKKIITLNGKKEKKLENLILC